MLTLYYKPTCPHCERVLAAAEELGISFNLKDITADETLRDELIEKGGKKQVPYLVDPDRNVSMYESGDIIDYLTEHYGNGTTPTVATGGLRIHRSDAQCDVCE
jgi:glutathione S-transferase